MNQIRWLTAFPSRLFARRSDRPDPRELARRLVGEMSGVKPGYIQVEGLRHLGEAEWPSDRAFDKARAAFEDELGKLTGVSMAAPAAAPQPSAPAAPPSAEELTSIAISLVGQSFSAPFDGSEERIEILRRRAWGRVDDLLAQGADRRRIAAAIAESAEELRAVWTR